MLGLFNGKKKKATAPLGLKGKKAQIHLDDVVKTYSNAAGDFTVLKGVDVEVYPGEFVAVIGKSGSGKSTLLNMVTGIDRPTSGQIWVGDTAVHDLSENRMAIWRGKNLGIVFQFFQLLPMLSLVENVMLPMDFCGVYHPRERKKKAMEYLDMVDMADHAGKLPSAISGGQQQRVAIARALANDPPVIVADEPTGNLDSRTSNAVFDLFENLVNDGKTIVMVTHDESQAKRVSRTLLIADGEIVNEYVARALPSLTHEEMLTATRQLEVQHFEPGQPIIRQGEPSDQFYIVASGQVEVALHRPDGEEVVVARFNPGEYFGEIELLRDVRSVATVRAALHSPVEVLALERHEIDGLLASSQETRAAIERTVDERVAENKAAAEGRQA